MSDKTFSPPSEEIRTKLLARSGQCERLVRESDRRAITGVSRTQWWTMERKQVAPARLKLGCNSVAWRICWPGSSNKGLDLAPFTLQN